MVIGPANCGKTSLVNVLNDYKGKLRKTQDTIYGEKTIDVPSSFVYIPWLYKHLIALSQDASVILLMVDQSNPVEVYSPGFAKVFKCPVIGIIAKADLNKENEEVCFRQLKKIGVNQPYFKMSINNQEEITALKAHLFNE
ncbi:MAG: EutP/PduV family microcompartment system protein [Anaerotignaceae bacterium]